MPLLPAVIVLEIISVFVVSSVNPNSFTELKQKTSHMLPAVLAEDVTPADTTAPDQTPPPPNDSQPTPEASPSDTSTATPSDTTSTTPAPENSQSLQPSATSLPNPTENPQQSPQVQATPSETASPSPEPSPENESQTQPVVLDDSQQQAQAASQTVINETDMISGPLENIDKNVEQQSAAEDQKLEQAQTPEEKTSLSVDFAKESVKAAEQSLKNDDLQTTAFVAQRISDQIDTAVSSAQVSNSTKPLRQISNFCKQADLILRTQQLSVPEDAAQDFEIIRGKCLNITQ